MQIEPIANQNEPKWEELTDKEKSVLVAMLVGKTNAETIGGKNCREDEKRKTL